MNNADSTWFAPLLETVLERRDLSREQMRQVMSAIMTGACHEAEIAALIVALRMKGESIAEVAAAAETLREHMIPLPSQLAAIDTCGTGGDGASTFNISTAAALITAGCGVPVVKHGNRAVSSRCGSADVLAALGVKIDMSPEKAARCLEQAGMAFLFAPRFHPALKHVAGVRRQLKVRTIFNCLGPLANPASPPYQLMGVGRRDLLDLMAGALAQLGIRRALIVSSDDGLDEVSLSSRTEVREVRDHTVTAWHWHPDDFGLEPVSVDQLRCDSPEESAAVLRSVLAGDEGPATRMALANAAACLVAAERAATPREGVSLAKNSLHSGAARQVLDQLIEGSR